MLMPVAGELCKRNMKLVEVYTMQSYDKSINLKEEIKMGFAENLQFLRQKKGYTQEQIAEQLQVSRQSVSKWESGVSQS